METLVSEVKSQVVRQGITPLRLSQYASIVVLQEKERGCWFPVNSPAYLGRAIGYPLLSCLTAVRSVSVRLDVEAGFNVVSHIAKLASVRVDVGCSWSGCQHHLRAFATVAKVFHEAK